MNKHLEIRAMPRFGSDGRQIGLLHVVRDITGRKNANEALRISEQAAKRLANESALIGEIGRIISSTMDIEDVYERFADKVRELIPFDRIAINTINSKDHTRTVKYVLGKNFSGNRIGDVYSLVGTGTEQVVRTKSSLFINSKHREDIIREFPGTTSLHFGVQSTLIIPLISQDVVIGVLVVHSVKMNAYSENDLRLAERMASQIAGSIANTQLFRERAQVEEQLQKTLGSLRTVMNTTIQVMVAIVEARDPYTAGHQIKSANLARAIATEMGLSQDKIEAICMAGSIHDIGKISIPAEILSKPTKLSEIEFALIKAHAQRGFEMLKDVESPWPLAEIVHQHHERMDGSGYPRNLKGDEICLEARILTVADVVEAMASHRPYRASLGIDAALAEIEKNRGIFYDEAVAAAAAKRLVQQGVVAVIGSYTSAVTESIQQVFDSGKIIQITYGSTAIPLTERGLAYFFRICPRDDNQAKAVVRVMQKMKMKRIAILHDDTLYGKGLAGAIKTLLENSSVSVVFYDALMPGRQDYSDILTKAKATNPDFVFFAGYYPEAAQLLKGRNQMHWRSVVFMGGDAVDSSALVDITGIKAAEGFYFLSMPRVKDVDFPQTKQFINRFEKTYKSRPASAYSLLAGDAFTAITESIKILKTTSTSLIADHLHNNYSQKYGLTGNLRFDPKGDVINDLHAVYRVDNKGSFILQRKLQYGIFTK